LLSASPLWQFRRRPCGHGGLWQRKSGQEVGTLSEDHSTTPVLSGKPAQSAPEFPLPGIDERQL
jgi:hypothetical protein